MPGRRQVIANGRRIGVDGGGRPTSTASCALRASISVASSMVPNSSARLPTMAEMVWACSGVSLPTPTATLRSARASGEGFPVVSQQSERAGTRRERGPAGFPFDGASQPA